jgi:hypothetical protein
VIAVVAVAVAGCTSSSEGSPRPVPDDAVSGSDSPTTLSSEAVDLPYAGAPAVEDPLDTAKFQQDPCKALTSTQTENLNVQSGEPHDGGLGNACEFRGRSDRLALIDIAFADKYPHGLSAVYQANDDGKWAFFEELSPIEGYPAVAYDGVDQRDTGGCAVEVGTSDEIAFEVSLQLSADKVGEKEPCETAAMVAGKVLQTMKAAR